LEIRARAPAVSAAARHTVTRRNASYGVAAIMAYVANAVQAMDLMANIAVRGAVMLLGVLVACVDPRCWLAMDDDDDVDAGGRRRRARFYVGVVRHRRTKPIEREFEYPLRCAVIDLDDPPGWFTRSGQREDHLSAKEARARAKTDGRVELLTSPKVFGYAMNPISVYYCYDARGNLDTALAEVTNTPWNERVVFAFDPAGASSTTTKSEGRDDEDDADADGRRTRRSVSTTPKLLHVSPFMDMEGEWYISSSAPTGKKDLTLTVNVVNHPVYGDYFFASFKAKLDEPRFRHCRNERAGIFRLIKYGCAPHRVAYWIYAQAVAILVAGVSFYAPPGLANVEKRGAAAARASASGTCPLRPVFRAAPYWPWRT
jgi:DUF1365 family protein